MEEDLIVLLFLFFALLVGVFISILQNIIRRIRDRPLRPLIDWAIFKYNINGFTGHRKIDLDLDI
jgi:hypothetical protein